MQTFIKTYRVTHIKITLYKKKQAAPQPMFMFMS